MKRFLSLLLVLALFVPAAFAEPSQSDIDEFDIYASVFGFDSLKLSDAEIHTINNAKAPCSAMWYFDSCRLAVTFNSLNMVNGAMINGSGDTFLNACAAIITYLDKPNFATNLGAFLFAYLMAQQLPDGEKELSTLVDGTVFHVENHSTYYTFMVVK